MASQKIPTSLAEVTPEAIQPLIAEMHPGTIVTGVEIADVKKLGQEVSTAGRMKLRLEYGNQTNLPRDVLVKLVIDEPGVPAVLYRTEVEIYRRILPELDIEKPLCLASAYQEGGAFMIILEDLSKRGATFPNVLAPPLTPDQMKRQLDVLATVHAQYWNSPRLEQEKSWLSSLTEGESFEFFDSDTVKWIDGFVAESTYRTDLITRVGRPPSRLWENVKAVHRHHEKIFPQTLQHGDTGAHNTYQLPDGRCGYLDWQLSVRGAWPHDVHYTMCTGLSVADRRKHEQALIEHYLAALKSRGVQDVPSIDVAMTEYARALIWGFTVGWLMVPPRNYGMEIISANLERLYAAATDLKTFDLADEVTG